MEGTVAVGNDSRVNGIGDITKLSDQVVCDKLLNGTNLGRQPKVEIFRTTVINNMVIDQSSSGKDEQLQNRKTCRKRSSNAEPGNTPQRKSSRRRKSPKTSPEILVGVDMEKAFSGKNEKMTVPSGKGETLSSLQCNSLSCKSTSSKTSNYDESLIPCCYKEADLLWGKVSGYPWWPCIVIADPKLKQCSRVTGKGSRQFHVEFLGEKNRCWVNNKFLEEFKDKNKYDMSSIDSSSQHRHTGRTRFRKSFSVPSPNRFCRISNKMKLQWEQGLAQAVKAMKFNSESRIKKFVNVSKVLTDEVDDEEEIVDPHDKNDSADVQSDSADKLRVDGVSLEEAVSSDEYPESTERMRNNSESNKPLQIDCSPPTKKKRYRRTKEELARDALQGKTLTKFDNYFKQHRQSVQKEHPKWAERKIWNDLRTDWNKLTEEEQNAFAGRKIPIPSPTKLPPPMQPVKPKKGRNVTVHSVKPALLSERKKLMDKKLSEGKERAEQKIIDASLLHKTENIRTVLNVASEEEEKTEAVEVGTVVPIINPRDLIETKKIGSSSYLDVPDKCKGKNENVTDADVSRNEHRDSENVCLDAEVVCSNITEDTETMCSKITTEDTETVCGKIITEDTETVCSKITSEDTETMCGKITTEDTETVRGKITSEDTETMCGKITTEDTETVRGKITSEDTETMCGKIITEDTETVCNKITTGNLVSSTGGLIDEEMKLIESVNETKVVNDILLLGSCYITASSSDTSSTSSMSNTAKKRQNICCECEACDGELIMCNGECQRYFHEKCVITASKQQSVLICQQCSIGKHICQICSKTNDEITKCAVSTCGRYFHLNCVKDFPESKVKQPANAFVCPSHVCASCWIEDSSGLRAYKGSLYQCLRCPIAYHKNDGCLVAGCKILANSTILCYKHIKLEKKTKHHQKVDANWCFICLNGGSLICCETCPASFHAECFGLESIPDGSFQCRDCLQGKKVRYGDIAWAKLGIYRWWPIEVILEKNVPQNILDQTHQEGEFPVMFLGSHEYFWMNHGRVFLYQENDKTGSVHARTKGIKMQFTLALKEAAEKFAALSVKRQLKLESANEKLNSKPAIYRHIKYNRPYGKVQMPAIDVSELQICDCKETEKKPCSKDSDCINRMLMIECHPKLCKAGSKCLNQDMAKCNYPSTKTVRTPGRGWGLVADENIKKGDLVNEYVGELIDTAECKQRIEMAHESDSSHFYQMTLDADRIIDAGPKGNLSRFMNHSCDPNCETQKWTVNGDLRVGIFALNDVKRGAELTFNYSLDSRGNEKKICMCGADNCSGFIGARPKQTGSSSTAEVQQKGRVKKSRCDLQTEKIRKNDSSCLICCKTGELLLCSHPDCTKAYHLACVNLSTMPRGKWTCTRHLCASCGSSSIEACTQCPKSYCATHKSVLVKRANIFHCKEHSGAKS